MKARWLIVFGSLPLLLVTLLLVPLSFVAILGATMASSSPSPSASSSAPAAAADPNAPARSAPADVMAGMWPDFLAAHMEQAGKFDPNGKLPGTEIAKLFYDAGCRGNQLVQIVAISGRESGWNPTAFNFHSQSTGDISLGLTQINVKGSMWGRLATFGLSDPRQLLNAENAAHATYVLSNRCTDLSPWGGYKGLPNTYNTNVAEAAAMVAAAQQQGLIAA